MLVRYGVTPTVASSVFREILRSRSVKFKDFRSRLGDLPPDAIDRSLEQLKHARLVEKKGAAIPDFTAYYLTAEGLRMGREWGL